MKSKIFGKFLNLFDKKKVLSDKILKLLKNEKLNSLQLKFFKEKDSEILFAFFFSMGAYLLLV